MELKTVLRVLMEDGETVTDYASEYGEPGYSADGPILLGSYWCRKKDCNYSETYEDGRKKVHALEVHYPRVFAMLEESGCELEWYDEWTVVNDRAYRTGADSYSWQPTAVFNADSCEYMVPEDGIEEWLAWAINDSSRCLMRRSFTDAELAAQGFVERECDYESGWFGREDNPASIMKAIQSRENVDVLFKLADTEQFRTTFCVYVRDRNWTEED